MKTKVKKIWGFILISPVPLLLAFVLLYMVWMGVKQFTSRDWIALIVGVIITISTMIGWVILENPEDSTDKKNKGYARLEKLEKGEEEK